MNFKRLIMAKAFCLFSVNLAPNVSCQLNLRVLMFLVKLTPSRPSHVTGLQQTLSQGISALCNSCHLSFPFQSLDARIIIGEFSVTGASNVFCEVNNH